MATMNISLPEAMKTWTETQVETGRYANTSDYVRDLIRRDQDRAGKIAAMQKLVDEGLGSGDAQDFELEPFLERMRKGDARKTKKAVSTTPRRRRRP